MTTSRYGLIELCAGTAAVSLAALGAPRFPCSRIGSKAGYTDAILEALEIEPGSVERVLLVEKDPRVASVLTALFDHNSCEFLATGIEMALVDAQHGRGRSGRVGARALWEESKQLPAVSVFDARSALIYLAGARGGVGGFKGKHKLRPSVDGFIPSLPSLAKRVRAFAPFAGRATVMCKEVWLVSPNRVPAVVSIDSPYKGRQGYGFELPRPVDELACFWRDAGHRVVVSEAVKLYGATRYVDITFRRKGQARKSLTVNQNEWLSVYEP